MSEFEILESVGKMPDSSKLKIIDKIYKMLDDEDIDLINLQAFESEKRIKSYENNELDSYDAITVLENLK